MRGTVLKQAQDSASCAWSRHRVLQVLGLVCLIFCGCDRGPQSPYGFTLPEGDATRGALVFQEMQCHACHRVEGIEQPADPRGNPQISVALGGRVPRIKTYGELVTAIINPSHRLAENHTVQRISTPEGKSRMLVYNDFITVTELCDLVVFLQSKYELAPTPRTPYPLY
ncbi:MAG: cytochrome C [Planctomycetota bacterium]